ncbi:MAG: hypothetical protein JXA75_06480 [Candidatus Thermoplasmatota archaeon]|nr:hypothetical protein [Candidatus Thermoplasmatota archaeon]
MYVFITYIYKETDINTLWIAKKTEANQEKFAVNPTDEITGIGFCSTIEMIMIHC